jgi:hypothetical protein
MEIPNSIEGVLAGAKDTLAKVNTESVVGNPTEAFAPKHEFANAPYNLARGFNVNGSRKRSGATATTK